MKAITTPIEFFTHSELECKGSRINGKPGTGIIKLHPTFATELVNFRKEWGISVVPNSVCRTPLHNKNERGHPSSLHLTENNVWPTLGSMAIDWPWRSWPINKKIEFCKLAWSLGWSIGLHDGFCHLDRRGDLKIKDLPTRVFLYGTSWSNKFGPKEIIG